MPSAHLAINPRFVIASQTAKAMKQLDPSVQLVVCGSSGEVVGFAANASARVTGTRLTIELPAVSWTAISLAV